MYIRTNDTFFLILLQEAKEDYAKVYYTYYRTKL